jgi:hypothetical protein
MKGENFDPWVLTPLMANLEELLLIVMDVAPYRSVLEKPEHRAGEGMR